MSNVNIHNTDVLEWLKNYNGEKFHSVISDPPYGLAFMGKTWDKFTPIQYQNWCTEWGKELVKHLYPGAVCMFFGGTRTYHRLATGLEDAGFEIFDSMMWCYGSGFPKSYNISKGIDSKFGLEREVVGSIKATGTARGKGAAGNYANKLTNLEFGGYEVVKDKIEITQPNHQLAHQYNGYGTALKPAFEPIVLCRKPRGKETFVDCALNYGSGSLNVDGSKIPTEVDLSRVNKVDKGIFKYGNGASSLVGVPIEKQGRFPANLGLICDCECEPCECIEKELDNQSGFLKTGGGNRSGLKTGFQDRLQPTEYERVFSANSGGASRFFYTAKSSRKERNLGLDIQNNHPTVKPIKLIEYLATMLKPPVEDSSILIPFSGSGSEIIGAMFAGWDIINALEIDENYIQIAKSRVEYWKQFSTYDKGLKGKIE